MTVFGILLKLAYELFSEKHYHYYGPSAYRKVFLLGKKLLDHNRFSIKRRPRQKTGDFCFLKIECEIYPTEDYYVFFCNALQLYQGEHGLFEEG